MSSVAASAHLGRTREWSGILSRELGALVLCTSAVGLATTIFVARATSTPDEFPPNRAAILALIAVTQLVPIAALWATDAVIRSRRPRWLPRFRAVLFGVPPAFLLMHKLGAALDRGAYVDDVASILLFSVLSAALLFAFVKMARRYPAAMATTYRFLLPAALVSAAAILFGSTPASAPPMSAAAPAVADPLPSVFVLVFDELGYRALLAGEGQIDESRYPNLAAFAAESADFSDASAHHFRSVEAVPELVSAVPGLADRTEVNLYLQYAGAEEPFLPQCGVDYDCFGASTLSATQPATVFSQYLLSYTWRATPGPLRALVETPRRWLADALGQPQAASDWRGTHIFTEPTFDRFIHDIRSAEPDGQAFVLHTMLSHFPYFTDRAGYLAGNENTDFWRPGIDQDATYANLQRHLEYTDARLGELLEVLRASGRLDDSFVILTADHGLRRGAVLEDEAPATLPLEVTSVPLLIHGPGIDAREYSVAYSHQDFEATLLDVLGLPAAGTGVSAFDRREGDGVTRAFVVEGWEDDAPEWHYERAPGEDKGRLVRIDEDPPER